MAVNFMRNELVATRFHRDCVTRNLDLRSLSYDIIAEVGVALMLRSLWLRCYLRRDVGVLTSHMKHREDANDEIRFHHVEGPLQ